MTETHDNVVIIDFAPRLAGDFERLNREWLETLFRVEPIDAQILADPGRFIIGDGGHILFAQQGTVMIGTVALKHHGEGRYELTKMAVTAGARGRGAGRLLAEAAIARFHELGGHCLYLESHSSLSRALSLYETLGFRLRPPPYPSKYERADVYMVYEG